MAESNIEDRVLALEQAVACLLGSSRESSDGEIAPVPENAWESSVGIVADDHLFDRIIEEGRRIRKADHGDLE